jgi:hypothetical protein
VMAGMPSMALQNSFGVFKSRSRALDTSWKMGGKKFPLTISHEPVRFIP